LRCFEFKVSPTVENDRDVLADFACGALAESRRNENPAFGVSPPFCKNFAR
jgi:hypothetical protein